MVVAFSVFLAMTLSSVHAYEALQGPTELRYLDKAKAYNGYTLFAAHRTTYLIDMEGYIVNTWKFGTNPRLLENGNLLDATKDDPAELDQIVTNSVQGEFYVIDHGAVNPALNTDYFLDSGAEYWWSITEQVGDSSRAWVVNAGGGIGAHPKSETISAGGTKRFHVRCVRDGSSSAGGVMAGDFIDNGDGTVTNKNTELMWQQAEIGATMTWEEALTYCENLSLAGYDDWRLPNIKELRSVNNDKLSKPSIDTTCFPDVHASRYWSSMHLTIRAWQAKI